jgi:hypothetical protein
VVSGLWSLVFGPRSPVHGPRSELPSALRSSMASQMLLKRLMNRLWLRFPALAISPALVLAASLAVCGARDFYIATNGNDSNLGTFDQPFGTLERGRDAIRALKQADPLPSGGIKVWLRGGRYMRQSAFALSGTADSGTPASPIVYQAYAGETPIIIGGINVTGFQAVRDLAILARLTPSAQTNAMQANLWGQGITNLGVLSRHGYSINWTGQVEFFFQDQPMQLAKYPNTGWLTIASSPAPTSNSFAYPGNEPVNWASSTDIWVHGFWTRDYADSCENVASINLSSNTVNITDPGWGKYTVNQRFLFFNVLEELDSPGEYYIDRIHGILYFWPPANITNGAPFVSAATNLVTLASVSNVAFAGITFEAAQRSLVSINGGASNIINGCALIGSSCDGVGITNSPGSGVAYCSISQMGQQGICLWQGGNRVTLSPGTNFASYNTVCQAGRLSFAYYPPIRCDGNWTPGSVGNYIGHNLIYNSPHAAIVLGGNNHIVEYNEIDHVCNETADAGAVYMGQSWCQRGNIIRYNYIHDINLSGGATDPSGVVGVYLDDLWSGTTVFGNILCAVDHGLVIGGGRDNIVQNNVFAGCTNYAIHGDQRGLNSDSGQVTQMSGSKGELSYLPYQVPPWSTEYPALVSILTNSPGFALGNVIEQNISYSNGMWLQLYDNAGSVLNVMNNFTVGDAQFVDYAHRNFNLSTNSPVWALGFQPIPMNRFGPGLLPATGLTIVGP